MKSFNCIVSILVRSIAVLFIIVCQTKAYAILEVTNGVSGGTLLIFPTTENTEEENGTEQLSAVYCALGTSPNEDLNGCDGAEKNIFTGISASQFREALLRLLPEAETKLIDSDHKFHVHRLNVWHSDHNFVETKRKRDNLERLADEIKSSLERLRSAGVQDEEIKNSPLSIQFEDASNQLKLVNDMMLQIEPSRSAVSHEMETIKVQALSEDVHQLAALAPSSDIKLVWLSLLSESENLKFVDSYWTGLVIDLGVMKNLRNKNYVIVAEPGSDKVSFFSCSPDNHPKGCLQATELQSIRMEKDNFISSASQLGIPIDEMITHTNLENQYRVTPNEGDILGLVRLFNGVSDRDKDFKGVDLVQGKIWWRAYDTCSRLQADELEVKNLIWKLPTVQQLRLSRDFLERSGWKNREDDEIIHVWTSAKPAITVGKMDYPATRNQNSGSNRYWSMYDPVYIPWVLVSPYCKLDASYTPSHYHHDVNKSSVSYVELAKERSKYIKEIESNDWRRFSAPEATAAAWLVTDY